MRKLMISLAVVAFVFVSTESSAQSQGDMRGSVGLALGTKASIDKDNGEEKAGLGINVGAEYFVVDNLSLAPNYTYFLPTDLGNDVDFSSSAFNIDARYYFAEAVYGFAGYSIFANKVSGGGGSVSVNEGAFNLGAGAMVAMGDAMNLNIQLKYTSILDSDIDFDQIVAQAGVAFSF